MNENFNSAFYKKILDQINSNIYVTDVETDEIVYMNDYMKIRFKSLTPKERNAGRFYNLE